MSEKQNVLAGKKGVLAYDDIDERYFVRFDDGRCSYNLHCGDTLMVQGCDGEWHDSRIEFSSQTDTYYLVGFGRDFKLDGTVVRK